MTPVDAMRAALEAEHAAVFVLGVLGGRLSASESPAAAARLRAAYDVHRGRRDHLRATLAAAGEEPPPPASAYDVDVRGGSAPQLLRVAQQTESRCSEVYAQMVAATSGDQRAWAVEVLLDSAVRQVDLGADPLPWPGAPEL